LVVALDGLYAGFVVGAYWSVLEPPMTIILPFLDQCISLAALVYGYDTYESLLSLIMTTCSTLTGLGYQSPFNPALRRILEESIDAIATVGIMLSVLHLDGWAFTTIIYKLSRLMMPSVFICNVSSHFE